MTDMQFNSRERFEAQARLNQDLNRTQMKRVVQDSLAQQFLLGDPKREEDVYKLGDGDLNNNAPSIQIKITGMLNEAMTRPPKKRPSIDIKLS
jgi:hypothetical protein